MPQTIRGLIIAGIVLILLIIIISAVVNLMFKLVLNRRGDGSPALRFLQSEDFPGLSSDPIQFLGDKKQVLRGFLYYQKNFKTFKELVIFTHGIGAGHTAYTTEINRLAQEGFLVLAYDYTGCMLSSGKAMKSIIQPLVDLEYALRYVESRTDLKDLKRYMVGHSWGGFVAMNSVLINKHRIDKVVSISGFLSPTLIAVSNRPILKIFYPFLYMHGFWRYGRYATYNGIKAVKKATIPMLFVHGQNDTIIHPKDAIDKIRKIAVNKEHIEVLYVENRGHSPFLSEQAEKYLRQVMKDKGIDNPKAPVLDYEIDYQLITEEDETVMKQIVAFLKN
ncbi:MAG: alpha/beta fold hydrolase [Bacilli bacterium]|jgi:alpha-beta hydrolase superfamily lysophospholipase|nr:alpha/beta fold hydrolase [Bacilli bacterium]